MNCKSCGELIPDGSTFCNKCGASQLLKCQKCGATLETGSLFCNRCGAKVESEAKKTVKKSTVKKVANKIKEKPIEHKTAGQEDKIVEQVAVSVSEPTPVVIVKQVRPKPSFLTVEKYLTPSLILGALFILLICSLFAGAVARVMGFPITQLNLFYIIGHFNQISSGGAIFTTSFVSSFIALIVCVLTAIIIFFIALSKLIKAFKSKQNVNLLNYLLTVLSTFVFASMVCYLGNSYQGMLNSLNGASIAGLVLSAIIITLTSIFKAVANKKAKAEKRVINKKSVVFNIISLVILFALQIILVSPLHVADGVSSTAFGMVLLGQAGGWMGGTFEALLPYLMVCTLILFVVLSLKRKIQIIVTGGSDKPDSYALWIMIFGLATTVFTIVTVASMPTTGMEGVVGYLVVVLSIVYGYISKAGRYAVINANDSTGEKLTGFDLIESYVRTTVLLLITIVLFVYTTLNFMLGASEGFMIWDGQGRLMKGEISNFIGGILVGCFSTVMLILMLVCFNRMAKGKKTNVLALAKISFIVFLIKDLFSILSVVYSTSFVQFKFSALKIIALIVSIVGFIVVGALHQKRKKLNKEKTSTKMIVTSLISFFFTFVIVAVIISKIAPAPSNILAPISMEELIVRFLMNHNADIIAILYKIVLIALCVLSATWCINNLFSDGKKSKFIIPIITFILIAIYSALATLMIFSIGGYSPAHAIILIFVSIIWFVCACIANKNRKKLLAENSNKTETIDTVSSENN